MEPVDRPVPKLDPEALGKQFVRLVGEEPFEFMVNNGNGGDALINAGAWQMFARIGVTARALRAKQLRAPARVHVYPGGGNLIAAYDGARRRIEARMAAGFDKLIMLPHTVRDHRDLFARMDDRFHIFCRERVSWDYVRQSAPRANAYLADDLALNLDVEQLLDPRCRVRWMAAIARSPRVAKRYLRWRSRIGRIRPTDGCLRLMRTDVEARGGGGDPTMDLSAQYGSDYALRGEAELVSSDFLRVLQRADRVETDRLHVGIGASLLGKETVIHDNNYGKNSAIYTLSMAGRFPKTRFVQTQF